MASRKIRRRPLRRYIGRLKDRNVKVEAGILQTELIVDDERKCFAGPSFSRDILMTILKLRSEGVEPLHSEWYFFDHDTCRDDPLEIYGRRNHRLSASWHCYWHSSRRHVYIYGSKPCDRPHRSPCWIAGGHSIQSVLLAWNRFGVRPGVLDHRKIPEVPHSVASGIQ